jgi:hypothetical protein
MSDALQVARDALAWALRFYRDHFWLVFGLSLVPTAQRYWVIEYDPPTPVAVVSEVLVALVRIALVVAVVKLMATPGMWQRLKTGITLRRSAFLLQWVILGLAFVVFDVIPAVLIGLLVPADTQNVVNATLVAVKNPTVIAMTILWMAGIAHTLSTGRQGHADEDRRLHYGTRE